MEFLKVGKDIPGNISYNGGRPSEMQNETSMTRGLDDWIDSCETVWALHLLTVFPSESRVLLKQNEFTRHSEKVRCITLFLSILQGKNRTGHVTPHQAHPNFIHIMNKKSASC